MKTIIAFSLLLGAAARSANAQEFPRWEIQLIPLQGVIDSGLTRQDPALAGSIERWRHHSGFGFAGARNRSRFVGLRFEVSTMGDRNTVRTSTGEFTYRQEPLWLMMGIQWKDNRVESRWKPFAHYMAGAARFETRTSNRAECAGALAIAECPQRLDDTRWSFVMMAGAGLDVRISRRFDLRLIHVEYAPLQRFGQTLHSVRYGLGVVIH